MAFLLTFDVTMAGLQQKHGRNLVVLFGRQAVQDVVERVALFLPSLVKRFLEFCAFVHPPDEHVLANAKRSRNAKL